MRSANDTTVNRNVRLDGIYGLLSRGISSCRINLLLVTSRWNGQNDDARKVGKVYARLYLCADAASVCLVIYVRTSFVIEFPLSRGRNISLRISSRTQPLSATYFLSDDNDDDDNNNGDDDDIVKTSVRVLHMYQNHSSILEYKWYPRFARFRIRTR